MRPSHEEGPRNLSARLLAWGLRLLLVVLPLVFNPFAVESFEAPKVIVFRWLVAALGLLSVLGGGWDSRKIGRIDLAVGLYAVVTVAATLHSLDPPRSFWGGVDRHGTLTFLCLVSFYLVVSRTVERPGSGSPLGDAVVLGSVPVSLYGFVQLAGLDPLSWTTDSVSPVLSTMGRSNYLGAYLAMVVPFAIARARAVDRRSSSARLWCLVFLYLLLIAFSQARAAWLGLAAGAIVYAAITLTRPWRERVMIGIGALGIALVVVLGRVNLSPLDRDGLAPGSFAEARADTVRSRFDIWRCTLPLSAERWVLGHGPDTFEEVFERRCPVASGEMIVDDPHNLVLAELMASGVSGTAALALVIVIFYSGGSRVAEKLGVQNAGAIYASATAYLVQAQFNPDVIVLTVLFWGILAVASRCEI